MGIRQAAIVIGYAIVLWAVPYATAIPLLGVLRSDPEWFHTIMIVEGSIVGAVVTGLYFLPLRQDFLRHGIIAGCVWLVLNWLLDVVALLPFNGMPLGRYFLEIGLRYVAMAVLPIVAGYLLERRTVRP